jgi:prepilin-type N-terminal cleavage/methylation domain-containing protein
MRMIVKALALRKKFSGSQRGFTLAEIMIVLIISAMLLVGSSQIVYHMTVTGVKDRAKANALCQVQYVGFWISEDVMQARCDGVKFGNETVDFLRIEWTQWNGDFDQVIYSLVSTDEYSAEGIQLSKLTRQYWYTPKGSPTAEDKGMTVVGEFLDPGETQCEWVRDCSEVRAEGNGTAVLKLYVAANVDGQLASRAYEISPRSQ